MLYRNDKLRRIYRENMLEISKENEFQHGNFKIKTRRTNLLEICTQSFSRKKLEQKDSSLQTLKKF